MKIESGTKAPTHQQLRKIAVLSYELDIVQPKVKTYNYARQVIYKLKAYKKELEELPEGNLELVLSENTLDTFSSGEDWMRSIEEHADREIEAKQVKIVDIIYNILRSLSYSHRNVLILSLTRGRYAVAKKIHVREEEVPKIRDEAYSRMLEEWEELRRSPYYKHLPASINFDPYILFIAYHYHRALYLKPIEVRYYSKYTIDESRIVYNDNPYLASNKYYWRDR